MIAAGLRDADRARMEALYASSFPENEMTSTARLDAHVLRGDAEWIGLYDNGFVGFSYVVYDGSLLFILYLAIDPGRRGEGHGSKALEAIMSRYPGRICFLNIEDPDVPCDNPGQRLRRLSFYERNGFSVTGRMTADGVDFVRMSIGGPVSDSETDSFGREHRLDLLFGAPDGT